MTKYFHCTILKNCQCLSDKTKCNSNDHKYTSQRRADEANPKCNIMRFVPKESVMNIKLNTLAKLPNITTLDIVGTFPRNRLF